MAYRNKQVELDSRGTQERNAERSVRGSPYTPKKENRVWRRENRKPKTEIDFSHLPYELRTQIWRDFAELGGRIIEMGYSEKHNLCVLRGSRSMPLAMMINREAQKVAISHLKYQRLGQFIREDQDERTEGPRATARDIWFSGKIDTMYFGPGTDLNTVANVMRQIPAGSVELVALRCSSKMRYQGRVLVFDEQMQNDRVIHGPDISALEVLHGIEGSRQITGCAALKKLVWVVQTWYKPVANGEVTPDVGFRPAATMGKTKGQRNAYAEVEIDTGNFIHAPASSLHIRENRWVGDAMPDISFQTLAPNMDQGKVHRVMVIRGLHIDKLAKCEEAFVFRIFEELYNCTLEVGNGWPDFSQGTSPFQVKELGFFGHIDDFPRLEKAVREILRQPLRLLNVPMYRVRRLRKQLEQFEETWKCRIFLPPYSDASEIMISIAISCRPKHFKDAKDQIFKLR